MSSPAAAVPRLSEAPAEVQRLLAKDICTGILEAETQRLLAEQRRAQERVDRVVESALKELPPALLSMKAKDALALESIQVLTKAVAASASGQSTKNLQAEPRQIYPRQDSTKRSNAEAELWHPSADASGTSVQGSDCSHSAAARAVVAAGATPLGVSAAGAAATPQSMRLAAAREKAAQSGTRSSAQLPSPSAAQLVSPAASSTAGSSSYIDKKQQYMEHLTAEIAKLDDAKDLMSITQQQMEKLPAEKRRAVMQRTSQMIDRLKEATECCMEEDDLSPTS
eukprot:TRINITY_DN90089_c0_g1_i1.p1 TRINITY_DN90089_c0_g1~~TRINITY_DN90089_c0_g1_i1.p1  ORF type:complete len:282 (-),score=83.21 TRINITY_DN90089_c0_g1_i1:33-878(-)